MTTKATIEQLQAFVGDEEFKQLGEALAKFNLFDAIGATHKELWHSDFLAFLLNPEQNHGLGDAFTKRLLRHVVPALAGIDSWEHVSVRREYKYIDILVQDDEQEVSVIIENKIWSPEAPCQLKWYWDTITGEHPPEWRTRGIFLTPHGTLPIEKEDREHYRALSYTAVRHILDEVLDTKRGQIDEDVYLVIRHYIDMLGRFIVGNEDADTLARELYFKHRPAIQLMNPARWKGWIKAHLEGLIKESEQFRPEVSTLEYVRFSVREWDAAEGLKAGTDKTTTYPMLYFDFYNYADSLTLYLWLGPPISAAVREQFLTLAEQNIPPFCKRVKQAPYHYCYQLKFLTEHDYATCSDTELKSRIATKWQEFMGQDLPPMLQALKSADWFWHAPGPAIPA